MKDLRKFIHPTKRVLVSKDNIETFKFSEDSEFHRVLNDEEIRFLLHADEKKNLFNGVSIRMDSISNGVCKLSRVGFFDFMTTNLVVKPASKSLGLHQSFLRFLSEQYHREKILEKKVTDSVKQYGRLNSFQEVLAVKELANIITVSIVLQDCTGRVLPVKHGNQVAVSSGSFATSAAGSLAMEDVDTEHPFINYGRRELKEELGLDCDLEITGMVISKQKLQPAILLSGKVNKPFEELVDTMLSAEDFNAENEKLYAVPVDKLNAITSRYQFTDVAAYQLYSLTSNS